MVRGDDTDNMKQRPIRPFLRAADKIWVYLAGRHLIAPIRFGDGNHDCALVALYWAVPSILEDQIFNALGFCTDAWPYGGVTNKEFTISLNYLKVPYSYFNCPSDTIGSLLDKKKKRCVALIHGHFVAIVNGTIVGDDAHRMWDTNAKVYCYWCFH